MTVISYKDKILKAAQQGFKDAVMLVGVEATKEISTPQAWEGFSDIRDIVDLGALRAAQQIVFLQMTNQLCEAEIRYLVEYADPVHNGAVIRYSNGNIRRIVGRPFIRNALLKINFPATIKKLSGLGN